MPWDKLPGYNINVPVQNFPIAPAVVKPAKGPMIAEAVEGVAKIIGDHFTPAARRKKSLENLTIAAQEKKLQNYLAGIKEPLSAEQALRYNNSLKSGKLLDLKIQKQEKEMKGGDDPLMKLHNSVKNLPPGPIGQPAEPEPPPLIKRPLASIDIPEEYA